MRWALAAIAFLSIVAVWPGIPAWALAPKWGVVLIGASLCLFWAEVKITKAHVLGGCLLAYAWVSLSWTPVAWDAANELAQLGACAAAFCVGAGCKDMAPMWKASAIALGLSALICALQRHGLTIPYQQWPPGGLFPNKNFMGEAAALVTVGLLVIPRGWLWLPGPMAALWCGSCRGAFLGLACAAIVWLWPRSKIAAIGLILLGLGYGAVLMGERQSTSDLAQRFMIWADAWDGLTFFGRGIGSYYAAVTEHGWRLFQFTNQRADHAHNDALELLFELGIPGLLMGLAFVGSLLSRPVQGSGLVLVCFVGVGLVGFPLHEPVTAFLGLVAAGNAAGVRYRLFDTMAVVGNDLGAKPAASAWRGFSGRYRRSPRGRNSIPA